MIGTAAFPQTKNPLKLKWAEVVFASLVFFGFDCRPAMSGPKFPVSPRDFIRLELLLKKTKKGSF